MAKNDVEQTFEHLKQTIPLLLKHKLSAIPTNYALWFTYVANDKGELHSQLDEAVAGGQTLSPSKIQDLYRHYLAESQEVDTWQLRQSVEAMLIELSQSMHDTRSDTQEFKSLIDRNLDNLSRVEKEGMSIEEVMGLVRKMVKETQAIRQSTISFNGALANAEKEIQRLRKRLEESEKDALYDALTGLCNRRYFDSELDSKIGMDTLTLMLVDIDHFKKINDNHGHLLGDLVLKAVARRLQEGCRERGQVFRYGGEEFAILLPNTDMAKARRLAESLRRAIEKITVKDRRSGDTLGDITASFGLASVSEKDNTDDLIARADKQLYEAKRLGRNRVMPIL